MPKIILTEKYSKKAIDFLKSHPALSSKYKKSLLLLEANPFHPSLRLHILKGNLVEYHSVSIDLKYRILIDFIIQDDKIILIDIGDHGLYE